MRLAFLPLTEPQVELLSMSTGINYTHVDFRDTRSWLCATVSRETHLALIVAAEFKTDFDAHVAVALLDKRALTRGLLQTLFATVFMRAKRISALVDPHNSHARECMERLGFVREGYGRLMIEGKRDAVMYGMTADDCQYLDRIPAHSLYLKEKVTHGLVA